MRFRLLGPLEVVHDGSPLPIRAARQRAVLAALLVDANRMVPLDVLVARVWDGDPPSRTALHNLVMRLRQTLGADVIRTRSDGYLMEVAEADLDLRHFDALVRRAKAATDPGRVSGLLAEALACRAPGAGRLDARRRHRVRPARVPDPVNLRRLPRQRQPLPRHAAVAGDRHRRGGTARRRSAGFPKPCTTASARSCSTGPRACPSVQREP